MLLNIALWVAGAALLIVGVAQGRAPYARYRALQETDANARRYDDWRGSRRSPESTGITGADVMRAMLRTQLLRWSAVAIIGVVLIVAGFAIR